MKFNAQFSITHTDGDVINTELLGVTFDDIRMEFGALSESFGALNVTVEITSYQHRRTTDRIPLGYAVIGHDDALLTSGTVYVKAPTASMLKGAQTRLERRLRAMYPYEAHTVRIVTRDVSRARMRTVR